MATELFERTMKWATNDATERGDLMRKVWQETPWMVDAYTGNIGNHGRYYDMQVWCTEKFGPEAWPIHGKPGTWYRGSATIYGFTWFGFATEEMMNEFCKAWPVPEGVEKQ